MHFNNQHCEKYVLNRGNPYSWTPWSDYDENERELYGCSDPIKMDLRQKENKINWIMSGNILVHPAYQINGTDKVIWKYGLPTFANTTNSRVYCFDELQKEAFPNKTRHCLKFEKRYCCDQEMSNQDKSLFRLPSELSTETKEEITPPKLNEIIWSDPMNQCDLICFLSLNSRKNLCKYTLWRSYDNPKGDNGTGDHELTEYNAPCGEQSVPHRIEAREKSTHLPYFVRNIVFHEYQQKYHFGPNLGYGLRFVEF